MGLLDAIATGWDRIRGGGPSTALARRIHAEVVSKTGPAAAELFGTEVARRDVQGLLAGIFPSGQPPKRGTRELLAAYASMPTLRAVTHRIAHSVAGVRMKLYAVKGRGGGYRKAQDFAEAGSGERWRMKRALQVANELEELPADHAMYQYIRTGNPLLTGREVTLVTQITLDLKGDAFEVKQRDKALGMPARRYPIPPYWVFETPVANRPTYRMQQGTWYVEVPEENVCWWRDPSPFNPYGRGVGLGEALADDLEIGDYAAKHQKAWFYNDATPKGLVMVKGANPAVLDGLEKRWMEQHQGFARSQRLHFTGTEISYQQLGQTFADQELNDLRRLEADTIRQTFGVPPEIFGVTENSNRATIDAADYLYAKHVVLPRLEVWRERWQRLAAEFDEKIVVDFENPVPADRAFLLNATKGRPYAFTNNEFREAMGLEPTVEPWGDERPPTPVVSPQSTETIPAGGGSGMGDKRARSRRNKGPSSGEGDEGSDDDDGAREPPDWDPDSIDDAVRAVEDDVMRKQLAGAIADGLQSWGAATFSEPALQDAENPAFNMRNPRVVQHLETLDRERIPTIGDSTRDYLADFLAQAYERGDGIDDIRRDLEADSNFAFGDARSERIARTEVLRSSNFGTLEAYKQSGVVDQKGWNATPGTEGERESHSDLDGTEIGIDEEFEDTETGATAQHPGGFGDPASDCNCRCSIYAAISNPNDDDKAARARTKAAREALYAQHAKARASWESHVRGAAAKALHHQREAVLAALRRK